MTTSQFSSLLSDSVTPLFWCCESCGNCISFCPCCGKKLSTDSVDPTSLFKVPVASSSFKEESKGKDRDRGSNTSKTNTSSAAPVRCRGGDDASLRDGKYVAPSSRSGRAVEVAAVSASGQMFVPPWAHDMIQVLAPRREMFRLPSASTPSMTVRFRSFDMFCCEYLWEQHDPKPCGDFSSKNEAPPPHYAFLSAKGLDKEEGLTSRSTPSSLPTTTTFGRLFLRAMEMAMGSPGAPGSASLPATSTQVLHGAAVTSPSSMVPFSSVLQRILLPRVRGALAQKWITVVSASQRAWYASLAQYCQECCFRPSEDAHDESQKKRERRDVLPRSKLPKHDKDITAAAQNGEQGVGSLFAHDRPRTTSHATEFQSDKRLAKRPPRTMVSPHAAPPPGQEVFPKRGTTAVLAPPLPASALLASHFSALSKKERHTVKNGGDGAAAMVVPENFNRERDPSMNDAESVEAIREDVRCNDVGTPSFPNTTTSSTTTVASSPPPPLITTPASVQEGTTTPTLFLSRSRWESGGSLAPPRPDLSSTTDPNNHPREGRSTPGDDGRYRIRHATTTIPGRRCCTASSLPSSTNDRPRDPPVRLLRELQGTPTSYGLFFQEQRKLGVGVKSIRSLWLSKAVEEKEEYDKEAAKRRCAVLEAKRWSERELAENEQSHQEPNKLGEIFLKDALGA